MTYDETRDHADVAARAAALAGRRRRRLLPSRADWRGAARRRSPTTSTTRPMPSAVGQADRDAARRADVRGRARRLGREALLRRRRGRDDRRRRRSRASRRRRRARRWSTRFRRRRRRGSRRSPSEGAINLIWEPNAERDLAGYIVLRGVAAGRDARSRSRRRRSSSRRSRTRCRRASRYVYAVRPSTRPATSARCRRASWKPRGECTRISPTDGTHLPGRAGRRDVLRGRARRRAAPRRRAIRSSALTAGRRRCAAGWPASRCWRRCGRRRSSASASTTRITRREVGKALPAEPLLFIKPSTRRHRAGRSDPAAARRRARRSRSRARRRHRPARAPRAARAAPGTTSSA